MASRYSVNRSELTEFLKDDRTIRAFENLANEDSEDVINIDIDSGSAISKSNTALSIAKKAENSAINAEVLSWLSM